MAEAETFSVPIAREIWERKYRWQSLDGRSADASLDETFGRVARAAAAAEKGGKRVQERWAQHFHGAMADLGFLPAGRILAGAGTGRAVTLFNCFVMGRIADDLGSIFENVKEAALTMQQGGGIGHDFSTLRPKGALVASIGADASGPVSFMDVWDAMCRTIMSAGARRGAMMGTLRCDHPDIEDFIGVKADARRLRNFNLSVLVTDAFMAAVREDAPWDLVFGGKVYRTLPARALWERLMRSTYETAEPGVIFIDRVNARNNLAYCEEIRATNPCVPAETWIQTKEGPQQVADLVSVPFSARVDGRDWSAPSGFFVTGRKPLLKLRTKEGYVLRLTAGHKVLAVTSLTMSHCEKAWREAGTLRPGDMIALNDHRSNPFWDGSGTFEQGYLLGLLIGDGTLNKDAAVLSVWKPRQAADGSVCCGADGVMRAAEQAAATFPRRADFAGWFEVAGRSEWRLKLASLRDLAFHFSMSPGDKSITHACERSSSDFHRGLLRGLFDTDGSVQGSQVKGASVRLAQSNLELLEAAQRMLLRLGVASTIFAERRQSGIRRMPDGKGGSSLYPVRAQHELVISGENLSSFAERIGFSDIAKSVRLASVLASYRRSLNRERFCAEVLSVEFDGEVDVYDVSVPGCNAFDANGLVAHNCGEQPLPPYGACLLGSLNLVRFVEEPFKPGARLDTAKLAERARIAVRFLDNVVDVSNYPLPAQRHEAKSKRRIGLGVTGLADALVMTGVRYGTVKAAVLAGQWMAAISDAAYAASAELAAEKGSFPLFEAEKLLASPNLAARGRAVREAVRKSGLRNGCLTSIAPTGTISLLAGNVSSGIEPIFDYRARRRVLDRDGSHHEETVEDYAFALFRRAYGEDAALPDTFVRASDLTPAEHLAMQAAVQAHTDSSISKTVNCPAGMAFADFKGVYEEAYALGLKGCTTFRPNAITGAVLTPVPGPPAEVAVAAAKPVAFLSAAERAGDVVYMSPPLEREPALAGFTYKLKWPESDHAIYVTINDIEQGGRRRPFEIFINTRNLEHYAWTVALTRMISAVFRRGGDVSFVADELKAVFDPQGGRWMDGRYVPSLLAAIGEVIERHMIRIGFLVPEGGAATGGTAEGGTAEVGTLAAPEHGRRQLSGTDAGEALPQKRRAAEAPGRSGGQARSCPRCSSRAFVRREGCWICESCGFSRCS